MNGADPCGTGAAGRAAFLIAALDAARHASAAAARALLWGATGAGGLVLDAVYPPRCVLCGGDLEAPPVPIRRPAGGGLRPWDRPLICGACRRNWQRGPVRRRFVLDDGTLLPAAGGCATGAELAQVVSRWKYHGVRGLGIALAPLAARALAMLVRERVVPAARPPLLVPVPLHGRRRRVRGFDQARALAVLAAPRGWPVAPPDLVRRCRATPQQARLPASAGGRRENVKNAFTARSPAAGSDARGVIIVDDLITSGATVAAVAAALAQAGWRPLAAVAAGLVPDTVNVADEASGAALDTPAVRS
ncbi:MAG: hypothetical protein R6X25_14450 [Candidatus Krumholzibacteriia bacterium]